MSVLGAAAQFDASQLNVSVTAKPSLDGLNLFMDKAPFDTLERPVRPGCGPDSSFYYTSPTSGRITGTNPTFGLQEVAQKFTNPTAGAVVGAVGFLAEASGSGTYLAKVYGVTAGAPGTLAGTSTTGTPAEPQPGFKIIIWDFSTAPAPVTGDFFLSSPVTGAAGDTIGFSSSRNGCGNEASYLKVGGNWASIKGITQGNLDLDLDYIVIVDRQGAGIAEAKLPAATLMPNPASDFSILAYNLKEAGAVSVKITNVTGQVVKVINEGTKQAGSYATSIDVKDLAAGTYIYQLTSNGKSTTGRLVVSK